MHDELPERYAFLTSEPGPKILRAMLGLYGLREGRDDAEIIHIARLIGVTDYASTHTPWCGIGLGWAVREAGYDLPSVPERAASWTAWGVAVDEPMLGDVLIYRRVGGGHVGVYVGEDDRSYHVLGCNQGDRCDIARFTRVQWQDGAGFGVVAARRSPWRIGQPANIRRIILDAAGPVGASVV